MLFLTLFAAMTMNVSAPGNDKRPVITISSPQNSLYNKTSILLNVSAKETISIWKYSLNGGVNSTFTQYTATTANATINASQGANSIIVYAREKQGQGYWNLSTVNFSVDSIPPVITIISPQNITYNTISIPLNVSANEVISTWKYRLNGGVNTTFAQYTTITANATITASQGANNITVYASDIAGNWNSSVIDFHVDTIPPSSITYLINISYANDYINWTWMDPTNDDFSYVMIYLNGEFKKNVPSGMKFYNATGLIPDTEYTIGTRTVDKSGNVNQTWVNHTARTLPPPPPTPCDSSCSWTVNYIVY